MVGEVVVVMVVYYCSSVLMVDGVVMMEVADESTGGGGWYNAGSGWCYDGGDNIGSKNNETNKLYPALTYQFSQMLQCQQTVSCN